MFPPFKFNRKQLITDEKYLSELYLYRENLFSSEQNFLLEKILFKIKDMILFLRQEIIVFSPKNPFSSWYGIISNFL